MEMEMFHHETIYRTREALARLREALVTVCGAGALGSSIAEGLARTGVGRLRLIDHDRVESHNLSNQPWLRGDVGAPKATLLANLLYRAVGAQVEAVTRTLTEENAAKLLRGAGLVIDAFDNSASRQAVGDACRNDGLACLHSGVGGEYGEVVWDEVYRMPSDVGADPCNYPLARNLAQLTAVVACEVAVQFLLWGERASYTITLRDLAVRPIGDRSKG